MYLLRKEEIIERKYSMVEKPGPKPPETDDPKAWEDYLSQANLDMDRGYSRKRSWKTS